jgi:tetratricopeptide (TPR) repeat protein
MHNVRRRPSITTVATAVLVACTLTAIPVSPAQTAPANRGAAIRDQVAVVANAVLAQRLAGVARDSFAVGTPTAASWRQVVALLTAAHRLDPTDPRYPQLLAEACTYAGDSDGAINALKSFRQLAPGDQGAQITLIDLYTSRFPVAEKRLAYLNDVIGAKSVPPEVRAHAALQAGHLYAERSQATQAIAMYDEAIRLNPTSPDALAARYAATSSTATVNERVALLLRILQANPARADRAAELAHELAAAGLGRASLDWYSHAVRVWNRQRVAPPHGFAVEYASQLLLADRQEDADMLAQQMLAVDGSDVDALLLRLLTLRAAGDRNRLAVAMETTADVLRGRVMTTRKLDTPAATQPVAPHTGELPDLTDDLAEATKPENTARRRALVLTLADLAWFQVYFEQAHQEADKTIAMIARLAGDDSPLVARLTGWSLLVQGRTREATVKLSAAADQDPLSAMGLARLQLADEKTRSEGLATARKVLTNAAAGLTGAIVWDGLRDQGVKRMAVNGAELIIEQLDAFPRQWLNVVEAPEQFYTVRGEPTRPSYAFGEPMYCRVTITNNGPYDITIGPNGLLKPDLWFDAALRGLVQDQLAGVTYDRVTQTTVLRPRQSITQTVRVDAGRLGEILRSNPTPSVQIFVSTVTNPVSADEKGTVGPGPAGLKSPVQRIFSRGPFPINSEQARAQVLNALSTGAPPDKFNSLDLAATIVRAARLRETDPAATGTPTPDAIAAEDKNSRFLGQFAGAVLQARGDATPAVSTWAWQAAVFMSPSPADSAPYVRTMLASDNWTTRLAGLLNLETALPQVAERKAILEKLVAGEQDEIVKGYAQALLASATSGSAPGGPPQEAR